MNDHSTTIVRVDPVTRGTQPEFQLGSLAEALLYYDRVLLVAEDAKSLTAVARWFLRSQRFEEFCRLIGDGTLVPLNYDFVVGAICRGNIQQGLGFVRPSSSKFTLDDRASSTEVRRLLGMGRNYKRFRDVIHRQGINQGFDGFTPSIREAEQDFFNPRRCELYLKAWLEREYAVRDRRFPPEVKVEIEYVKTADGVEGRVVTWCADKTAQADLEAAGVKLPDPASVLASIASSTLLVWSAASRHVDLHPGPLLTSMCCDKIAESLAIATKPWSLVNELEQRVEFPDVAALVNNYEIDASLVLDLRQHTSRFRQWMQSEAPRDRDAIVAYHNEVADQRALRRYGGNVLRVASFMGGAASGAAIETAIGGASGGVVGASVGSTVGLIGQLAEKLSHGWKPVVFGNWLATGIKRYMAEDRTEPLVSGDDLLHSRDAR